MALHKHDIPLFEYDDSPTAVLMPDHEQLALQLPEKAVFAFLGDVVENYAQTHRAVKVGEFISTTKTYPIYVVDYEGRSLCLCQAPAGAPAAVQILDWLCSYGVTAVISTGSCGALTDLPENSFLVPAKALRDEGTSYHYLPPSRFVELNQTVLRSIEQTLIRLGLPYTECTTWTTDGFYRETREKVAYRKAEGCSVVEMECAALAACAQFRGIRFGQVLYTADSLANADAYDERGWGSDSLETALHICLEIAKDL